MLGPLFGSRSVSSPAASFVPTLAPRIMSPLPEQAVPYTVAQREPVLLAAE
jgi:hypothetical protein